MEIDPRTSARIEWSFVNVTHRSGAAPQVGRADMLAEFGETETNRIVGVIQQLIDQTNVLEKEIDWNTKDLAWGEKYMERRLQEQNPGLTQPAANWIARYFSYLVK